MQELSDAEAFDRYRKHPSSESLATLLRNNQSRAYNLCFQVLHQREEAEDAAQEALIKLIEALPRIESSRAFRHWLYSICVTCALKARRSGHRRQFHESRHVMTADLSGSSSEESGSEQRLALFEALERLDIHERTLIVEHYFEKKPLEEIAIREGLSKSTIWKRIQHARLSLKASLVVMGTSAVVPGALALLESCRPVSLASDLVPGVIAKAAATSALNTAIMGGTVVATKGAFVGLTVCIATLALLAGGTTMYMAQPRGASPEKVRELETRLATMSRELERARSGTGSTDRKAGSSSGAHSDRIAELEAHVRELKKANEEALGRSQGPPNKAQGGKDSAVDKPLPLPADFDVDKMVDLLGLDAARMAQVKRAHEEVQAKIRQLESEMAKVDSKDDRIRIELPSFGERGKQLKDEWDLNLSYALTPAEREKYTKHQLGRTFFDSGRGFGEAARTLELIREGQRSRVSETWQEGEGTEKVTNEYSRGYDSYEEGATPFKSRYKHVLR